MQVICSFHTPPSPGWEAIMVKSSKDLERKHCSGLRPSRSLCLFDVAFQVSFLVLSLLGALQHLNDLWNISCLKKNGLHHPKAEKSEMNRMRNPVSLKYTIWWHLRFVLQIFLSAKVAILSASLLQRLSVEIRPRRHLEVPLAGHFKSMLGALTSGEPPVFPASNRSAVQLWLCQKLYVTLICVSIVSRDCFSQDKPVEPAKRVSNLQHFWASQMLFRWGPSFQIWPLQHLFGAWPCKEKSSWAMANGKRDVWKDLKTIYQYYNYQ